MPLLTGQENDTFAPVIAAIITVQFDYLWHGHNPEALQSAVELPLFPHQNAAAGTLLISANIAGGLHLR